MSRRSPENYGLARGKRPAKQWETRSDLPRTHPQGFRVQGFYFKDKRKWRRDKKKHYEEIFIPGARFWDTPTARAAQAKRAVAKSRNRNKGSRK